ncbi:two-component system OmpR family response regulator [Pseudochelatococcus lubricantis]|uniref:Two-component system OmpR family response regulator n=1 Tax=Pseudochelatococcus lubricantis TaxID=1538102 RepID=A0ABX0V4N5_9HYPH|nr:response regulator transcription factor [Pseudochelatococcus lubricantis]NIJ58750.1 two-component system OmpR family response regulator [Pseudochelatococcus lubricantis]
MRILIVEDDDRTAGYIERALVETGHIADRVGDGPTGLAMASEGIYDVIILDQLLPELAGTEILAALRTAGNPIPVLMLSALGGTLDKVAALNAGADDYLVKPYATAELIARLEALLRRKRPDRRDHILRLGDFELDMVQRRARRGERRIDLQHREFLLVEYLMRHAGQVVTRTMLLEAAWPYDFEPKSNVVDMHIHRLRRKIDGGFASPLIHTIPGAGYLMRASNTAS